MAYKIAIIVGSLREGSLNRKMARAICGIRDDNLDCSMVEIGNLPLYNQDHDANPPPEYVRFRERVAASIAVERFVPVAGDRGVIVTARRDLGADGGISWHSSLTRGLTWQTDGVQAVADEATAQLRAEFDLR